MPRVCKTRAVPVEFWPTVDQHAWLAARQPASPFFPQPSRSWREVTWTGVKSGYGYWLSWLNQSGLLEPHGCPAGRATEERMYGFQLHMEALELSAYSVADRLGAVGRALRVMVPDVDTSWIELGASRLHALATPVKNIRQIARPAADLVDLGWSLMESVDDADLIAGSYSSLRFRDGLMIAFLIHCPLRRLNLTALELGVHVFQEDGVWRVDIPARETKTERAIRCAWPPALVGCLEIYLSVHRPILLRCGHRNVATDRLWISRQGKAATAQAVYQSICDRTEAAFGAAINPHVFRHIAATDLATNAPECALAIMDILGQSRIETSDKYYNQAKLEGAAHRMHVTFEVERQAVF